MTNKQRIALIFSGLSFVVVLANISVGIWIYIPLLLLFVASYFIKNEIATLLQIIAISLAGIYISIFQDEYSGYAILFIALMLLFSSKSKYMKYYILGYSIIILILSFITVKQTSNRYIHSLLDSSFFAAYASIIWIIFREAINKVHKQEEENRSKYWQILEEATSVAREALDRLEKLRQGDKDGR